MLTSEDRAVTAGIVNWTSWMTNEQTFGYAGVGATCMIDAKLYSKISDTDFRKLEFVGPNGPVEGQIFFDYKRLNKPVDRTYENNNWPTTAQLKTTTRPAWMNWLISINEVNNNAAVRDYNNPSCTDAYK